MKDFFKFLFASFLGTLLSILILAMFFIGFIAGIVALTENKEVEVSEHSILHINWNTPIVERTSNNPLEEFDFASGQSNKPVGLNDIIKNIDKAIKDPKIEGIFLDIENIDAGSGTLMEIRNKLVEFKESGKFIISYANGYSQGAYYLASLSDEIYMNPEGMMMFKGLNAQVVFLKGMLDKLEIDMQIVRGPNNKFKSAVEPLMLEKMSEANREQIEKLINSVWGQIILAVSESRGISIEDLNTAADNLDLADAGKALELNFVDGLLYRDELILRLKEKTGVKEEDDLESVSFKAYTNAKIEKTTKLSKNKIAVIYALGSIEQGNGGMDVIGSASLSKTIRKAREDDKIKAVVFRVNSPGGDALASEVIRREVELTAEVKPIIVSMGDVAASGGYWISTNADYIFAQPTTITGSIGVFGVIPNFKGFFNDKLGITFDKVMTNKNSDFIDVMEPMNPYQQEVLNQQIIKIYDDFVNLVASTRNLEPEFVDDIARGRVWTGVDALEIGLVDQMGGVDDAIAYAAEAIGVGDDYNIREYPLQKDFFEQIVEEITGNTRASILESELGELKSYYSQIKTMQNMQGIQARLPFIYTIK